MAQASHVRAAVVPIGRRVRLSEPDQRQLRVRQVDQLLRATVENLDKISDLIEPLELDYGDELPAHEDLRILGQGIDQVRGGLRQAVGID